MSSKSLNIVRESLQAYADRGVFRGFSEAKSAKSANTGRFTFVWFFHHPMELIVDTTKHELRFKQLLPGIPAKSPLYVELKSFVEQRHDRQVPEHRRIDRRRAEVACFNRGGMVSISLLVKKNQYAYGINRIVNLIHELFVHLRNSHPDYLVENFDVPQE